MELKVKKIDELTVEEVHRGIHCMELKVDFDLVGSKLQTAENPLHGVESG